MRPGARFRASASLLFMAAVAFGVALLALSGEHVALANSTGILIPTGQGYYSGWNESGGGSEVGAIDDGVCGTGDGFWITGQYNTNQYSSYKLNLSSMPPSAAMQGIDITVCYSDADGTDLLQQVTPFVRKGGGDTLGTGIDPKGSTTIASVTQHFDLGGWLATNGLELGLKDVGFIGRVKVWAIWAVITYDPPPTPAPLPTVQISATKVTVVGQQVEFQTDVTVPESNAYLLEFVQTWDPAILGTTLVDADARLVGTVVELACAYPPTWRCLIPTGGGTWRFTVTLAVQSQAACSTRSDMLVHLILDQSTFLAQSQATAPLNGGCSTPTPTATATFTSTATATSTGTSATSSATATGTSALATSTPTGTAGGATTTPNPGAGTPTPTATPTIPPLSARPYRLREMQIARDGAN